MRVHKVEEGLVVGGGVVISRVVVSLLVGNNDVTVELQLGIGGVGGGSGKNCCRGESEAGPERGQRGRIRNDCRDEKWRAGELKVRNTTPSAFGRSP